MGIWKLSILVLLTAIAANIGSSVYFHYRNKRKLAFKFGGHAALGFEGVERAFHENFQTNIESGGAAFAVYHKGHLVVDLWAGYSDAAAWRPWSENTLSLAFSSTKGVAALCVAMLVDRGSLSYDDLVTQHWPEFGQNGKENVTVKMLVNHEAGLAAVDSTITLDHIKDWRLMSTLFEKQKPHWPPGKAAGYHGFTYGWLVDQLVRRCDPKGRGVVKFFREEVSDVYGLEFYIGSPQNQEYRISRLTDAGLFDMAQHFTDKTFLRMLWNLMMASSDSLFSKMRNNLDWMLGPPDTNVFNNPDVRGLEMASVSGTCTARDLARIYALAGSKEGLFKNNTVQLIAEPSLVNSVDFVLGFPISRGWGFWHWKNPKGQYAFGHPGFGGQNAKLDIHNDLAFAYLRNHLVPDIGGMTPALLKLEKALYDSIDQLVKQDTEKKPEPHGYFVP